MFGISYGELFLLIGATAALIGPKDLPVIARTAGRLAGRAIGYVQLARGQFENVMQQSQARQVHKELQETMAQLDAIRHEIRSISVLNPGPQTRRLVDNIDHESGTNESTLKATIPKPSNEQTNAESIQALISCKASDLCNLHSQAVVYERLAESSAQKTGLLKSGTDAGKLIDDVGLLNVLPVSAESTGMLPNRREDVKGSDVLLEAILEAKVAQNAKDFFAQPQNQIKYE